MTFNDLKAVCEAFARAVARFNRVFEVDAWLQRMDALGKLNHARNWLAIVGEAREKGLRLTPRGGQKFCHMIDFCRNIRMKYRLYEVW